MSGTAVILAGGRGTRLAPYTAVFPKPLVPIGNQPVVDILCHQLVRAGFDRLVFCVGHLAGLIEAYFVNHPLHEEGVAFEWIRESRPLGTAGPVRLVPSLPEDFLVVNGDLLTTLDFRTLSEFHRASGTELTIAARSHVLRTQLGVIEHDGPAVTGYTEKPSLQFDVSLGVYAYSRSCIDLIPPEVCFDFPDLVNSLVRAGRRVGCMITGETWLDIGNPEDYAEAQQLFAEDPGRFGPRG